MPVNNIKVGLGKMGTMDVLDVKDNGGHNVEKSPQPTTIVWDLNSELANASFAAMDGTEPGFQWEEQPPAGVFGLPTVLPNGKLEIVDYYSDSKDKGEWVYKLRVVHGNKIYTTITDLGAKPSATAKNPVIINKDP